MTDESLFVWECVCLYRNDILPVERWFLTSVHVQDTTVQKVHFVTQFSAVCCNKCQGSNIGKLVFGYFDNFGELMTLIIIKVV